jgi:hypothetical protein
MKRQDIGPWGWKKEFLSNDFEFYTGRVTMIWKILGKKTTMISQVIIPNSCRPQMRKRRYQPSQVSMYSRLNSGLRRFNTSTLVQTRNIQLSEESLESQD